MDDDLHGRQLVLLIVFFGSVGGVLYLIGWLTRPGILWDPLVCAAIAGMVCYPGRFLVERFGWWKRLAEPRAKAGRPEVRRSPEMGHRGRRRRLGVVRVLRVIVGVPVALASLAIMPAGIASGRDDERLVEAGPVQEAVVVSVEKDRWSRYDDYIVKVARPGDGATIELQGGDQLDPMPVLGDRVGVVVDREDPTYVIAAAVDWSTPWWVYPLYLLITVSCLGMGLAIAFG